MAELKMKMGKNPKRKMYKGNINICDADIPEVKDWSIGDKVTLTVDVEVSDLRKADMWEQEEYGLKKDSIKAGAEITSIKLK